MSSQFIGLQADEEECVRRRLISFYERHNPRQLEYIDNILFAYKGHWDELFVELAAKYEHAFWQNETTNDSCSCPSNRGHFAGNDSSSVSSSRQPSDGSVRFPSFTLLDPMEVVQRRRSDGRGGGIRNGSLDMIPEKNNNNNDNRKVRKLTLLRQSFSGDAQEDINRRLRLQQLFMRFAPREVLRMEEFMAQYREAYMMDIGSANGHHGIVTEKEWQEAMIHDLLCEFDRKKNGNRVGYKTNKIQRELYLKQSPSSFTSHVLFPFSPADPLDTKPSLGPRLLQDFCATEPSTLNVRRRKERNKGMTCLPFISQPPLTPNNEERTCFHVETSVDEWCEPPKEHLFANSTQGLLASEPEKSYCDNTTPIRSMGDAEKMRKSEELSENGDFPLSSIILNQHTHGKRVCMLFFQTPEERKAEEFLLRPAVRRALACPLFHYRLFLLLCISMEAAQGGGLTPQGGPILAWSGEETRIPYWEPSLAHRVHWRGLPPQHDDRTFFQPSEKIPGILPYDLLDTLHASRSLVRTVGLGSLWCDEVTFADVVAVRMRYFARRYPTLRWLVLRPFACLRNTQECVQHFCPDEPQWQEGNKLSSLLFIDAVTELICVFGGFNEHCWAEFIEVWKKDRNLLLTIAALQGEFCSHNGLDDMGELCSDGLGGTEKEEVCDGENGKACISGIPRSVSMLLSCTAFLSLHFGRPFSGISCVDIFATYHCLRVAAIAEEENYRRLTILQTWGEECDALRHLEVHCVALVSLQERERCQRGKWEVEESSTRLELFQSVLSWLARRSHDCCGPLVAQSSFGTTIVTAVGAYFPQSILRWRREAMQQRIQAFFRSASEYQQRLNDS
ncbi:hypothetical protein MOQ_004800 [Trypanosoma cruzi marinkellei]|uniref:Uncharacterized protein n=1 Tax=Trypanosoma cruzi marinkellei TaxID=85056 RepID=K2MW64_TRYCR|nr:hypothetical protein MOQ_004800 [Trypanosoma cruzi marinkellei]